jgi:hypothetical protein
MQEITRIITPAGDFALISQYYARMALNLQSSTDPNLDEQIEMFVRWASDDIAELCNRVFAKETVEDTYLGISSTGRIYLSHYPIASIASVTEAGSNLVQGTDYIAETATGLLRRQPTGTCFTEPVVVTYTGGYVLPYEAPESLQQASVLLIREAYYASLRGDATIRMVSHKESRVIYFDPAQQARALMGGAGGAGTTGGTAAMRSVDALLKKFTRFWA